MPDSRRTERTRQTRERIAAIAMDLFSQGGFEGVTVAEIAKSAGVTEKTVFNHFATKEDLVYSTDRSFEDDLVTAIRRRDAGVSVYAAATTFLVSRYTAFPGDKNRQSRTRIFADLVATSAALQARERLILARYAATLGHEIAADLGAGAEDLRPQVVAEAIISVHAAIVAGFRRAAGAGSAPDEFAGDQLNAARQAIRLLSDGLGDYGPKSG